MLRCGELTVMGAAADYSIQDACFAVQLLAQIVGIRHATAGVPYTIAHTSLGTLRTISTCVAHARRGVPRCVWLINVSVPDVANDDRSRQQERLAGEARTGVAALGDGKHLRFGRLDRRQILHSAQDMHVAGRARAVPAAFVGNRDSMTERGIQNRVTRTCGNPDASRLECDLDR